MIICFRSHYFNCISSQIVWPPFFRVSFLPGLEKTVFRFVRDRESDEIHLFLYRTHLVFNKICCSKHKVFEGSSTWKTMYFVTFPVSDEPKTSFFKFRAKNWLLKTGGGSDNLTKILIYNTLVFKIWRIHHISWGCSPNGPSRCS